MLYTFFGSDIEKIRARSRALVDVLREKRSEASYFRIHQENWNQNQFTELTQSQGLFSSKYIVLLDNLLTGEPSQKETKDNPVSIDVILENLETLKKSEHIWIIVEDAQLGKSAGKELGIRDTKALGEIHTSLKKHSDKIEEYDHKINTTPSSRSTGTFRGGSNSGFGAGNKEVNSFTFTDAFFEKRTVDALNALTVLDMNNTAPEEVHGALWWQTKSLMQIIGGSTKSLSPYVVQKGERFMKRWKKDEMAELTNEMIESYHESHLGKKDLKDELVKMTLRFCK